VLADQGVVQLVAVAVEQHSAADQRPGRTPGIAVEPAAEQVLAAAPDAVQPDRRRGEPGEQRDHAARVLLQPRLQLPGRGDLSPLIQRAA